MHPSNRDLPWYGPRQPRTSPQLRVSDAERNAVADTLSQHYADGRLDANEFKERLEATMAAKTRGDLSGLLTDLPPLGPPQAAASPHRRSRTLFWVALFLVLLALWSFPWPGFHLIWLPHLPLVLVAVAVFLVVRSRRRRSTADGA